MKKETKNPHIGHRERMLSRLDRVGSEAFEDHELLEALLFYALPRVNTNEIAHALMDKFASLDRVMSASIDALSSVDGISKKTGMFISIWQYRSFVLPEPSVHFPADRRKKSAQNQLCPL